MTAPRWLPGVRTLASYRGSWLRQDVVAGLVLTALLVPQGMAYAQLAGLPAITGLYTSVLCLIAYALFGPSRVLVLGPDSSLGPMIAATILPIIGSNGSPERAIALASMLALIVGVIMITAGILKLGFVADLLSKPTQIGYMNGLALTILIGQLPKLLGFSVDASGLINETRAFVDGLASGNAVGAAAAIGLVSLALILALARWLGSRACSRRSCWRSQQQQRSISASTASHSSEPYPRDSRRSPCPTRSRTSRYWWREPWESRSLRSPTRSPQHRPLPLAPARNSTGTGR
jgi:MFS superfamily sulfate permease-like transporter